MNARRVAAVAHKEWREIVRDRIFCALAFLLPVLLMLVFGYGMTQDVQHVPFAILDEDRSAMSRDYAHRYTGSRYFAFQGYLRSEREIGLLLADGKLRFVLVIPPRFQERLLAGRSAAVQTLMDGTFTRSIRTTQGYIEAINSAAAAGLQAGYLSARLGIPLDRAAVMLQPIRLEVRYLYNEEVRAIWAVAPSLIMLVLSLAAPMLTALGVVREKETGAIYNIYASTTTRLEFLAGKLLPYVLISFINGLVLWAMATAYFGAPFRGSFPFFLLATLLYVFCAGSAGLLLSLVVQTQQAALMIAVIVSFLIVSQFSGLFTPVPSLTGANYVVAHLLPPMYYNNVIEGVFLKGMGFAALWWEAVVIAVQSAGALALAYLLFHKRTRT